MSEIYFPLRSNVDYWNLGTLELDLESRIKLSALLFDYLVFQSGGYTAFIGPKIKFDLNIPNLGQVPDDYFSEPYPVEGGEFNLQFGKAKFSSPAVKRYKISFQEILTRIGIEEFPWIRFDDQIFTDDAKQAIKVISEQDVKTFRDDDRKTYLLQQSQIFESLNYDWAMASLNNWGLNLDPLHQSYLDRILTQRAFESETFCPPVNFDVIFPRLPDLTQVSWEQIVEVREHASSIEFRQKLSQGSSKMRQAFLAGESADAIRYHIMQWRDDQLITEIEQRLKTKKRMCVEIVASVGFLIGGAIPPVGPFIGLIDGCRSIYQSAQEYMKDKRSIAATFVQQSKRQSTNKGK